MSSVQRFLSGRNNVARSASLVASSVLASTAVDRLSALRAGSGRVRLLGSYTGHEAAEVQVQVLASPGGTPRASAPQFVGVGSGQLALAAVAPGAPLQQWTLTLQDLGVPTAHALLDVRELQLRARAPGAVGNSIRVTVSPQLVRTATPWALLADWRAGAATQQGVQWDFGALPLSPKDELDAATPRIAFGHDPQVYRPWRRFKDGDWQFGLSPQLQRDVPAGTPVCQVAGGYVVAVSDGVLTETFGDTAAGQAPVLSFYDLLTQLATSTLVEVAGVVAADRSVGGQAAIDVPLRTSAWLLALAGRVRLQDVGVPPAAPTQSITVRCTNADVLGAERWAVAGDVSGAMGVATTGLAFTHAAIGLTVPSVDPQVGGQSGRWSFKFNAVARDEDKGEGLPSVCVRPFKLGANAQPRTVTFRYAKRPPADCKCSDVPTPKVSDKCLGINTTGGGDVLDPEHGSRLQALYAWRRDFHAANWVKYYVPPRDLDFADAITDAFAQALGEIYEAVAARTEWDLALAAMKLDMQPLESPQFQDNWGAGNLWAGIDNHSERIITRSGVAPDAFPGAPGAPWVPVTGRLLGNLSLSVADLVRKYKARMDYCRVLADIVPKSDPSSTDAGGCWVDHGGTHWWVDVDGYFLPAFTNQAYISARRNTETGAAYSTKEFGFGLVVACPERLKIGDEVTIRIEAVDGVRPYSVGDEAVIQTIGAGPAWLAGGVDGTDVQTWSVRGSVSGALADYVLPTDGSPAPLYVQQGVSLQLALGGIAFALGDSFSFAVEAGQFQWRSGAGAWSAPADVPASGTVALPDGLVLQFDAGAAPSFVPGDAWSFAVHQPHAPSQLRSAKAGAWRWVGAGAQVVLDAGSVVPVGAVALARYALPLGCTVQVELSADGVAWGAPVALDVSGPVALALLPGAQARMVRVSVAGGADGSIGFLWVGEPLATSHHASSCTRTRRWAAARSSAVNAASLYAGVGTGWQLGWEDALSHNDAQALMGLLDWHQAQDEALVFVPHHLHPQDAALVRCAADALELSDVYEYQPDVAQHRLLSATLALDAVFA